MKILLASPRGFCAGVKRAVRALDEALAAGSGPIWALHEIVHNASVVERFRRRGVRFVDSLEQIPDRAVVLFSAHGVAPKVREKALARGLTVIDAACPLVERVHRLARSFAEEGYHILYIGHRGHQEVIGTLGEAPGSITLVASADDVPKISPPADRPLTVLMQTTLSFVEADKITSALRERFPRLVMPPDAGICFATRHRQEAVQTLLPESDAVVVVGSANSSNSRRLAELPLAAGKRSRLIDSAADLRENDFSGGDTVLLTAGASAPEELVEGCLDWFRDRFGAEVRERTVFDERTAFRPVIIPPGEIK